MARAYTYAEIEAMRAALLMRLYPRAPTTSSYFGDDTRQRYERSVSAHVEDVIRTYIAAGTEPDEVISAAKPKPTKRPRERKCPDCKGEVGHFDCRHGCSGSGWIPPRQIK